MPPEGSNAYHGFSVTKNGQTYDFYSGDSQAIENWVSALKKVCILTNFHDEYKALKMIGRGSFAKVFDDPGEYILIRNRFIWLRQRLREKHMQ